MPIVAMPNGDQVAFPDDMPKADIQALIARKFPKEVLKAQLAKGETPPLSRAITDIPSEIGNEASAGWEAVKRGLVPGQGQAGRGQFEHMADTAGGVFGLGRIALSPFVGAAKSIGGHLMAQGEHAVGTIIAPETAAKDDYGKMYDTAKGDVELALLAGRPTKGGAVPSGPAPGSPGAPPPIPIDAAIEALAARSRPGWTVANADTANTATPYPMPVRSVRVRDSEIGPGQEVANAAGRVSEISPVDVPRALASDSTAVQRIGQGIRNVPLVGDAIPKATAGMVEDMGQAVNVIADSYGSGTAGNAASRVKETLSRAAAAETGAGTAATEASDAALLAAFERDQAMRGAAIDATEAGATRAVNQQFQPRTPQEMGADVNTRLPQLEQAARAEKDRLYGIAGQSDAVFSPRAVEGIRPHVDNALFEAGREAHPTLTPASFRMMEQLGEVRSTAQAGRPMPEVNPLTGEAGINIAGIEQTRKALNQTARAATNPADRSMARAIIRAFDDWQGRSFDNALISGSPEALNQFRQARAANRDWRERFGFNERDDADRILNRIVEGNLTPQETANFLVGSGQVGSKGSASRLFDRLVEATGGGDQAAEALRGGVWHRLTQASAGVDAKNPIKVANEVNEFLNGSGQALAQRLYTPQQRAVMQIYADTLRAAAAARTSLAEAGAVTRPTPSKVGVGPVQELANAVLGSKGVKADEAIFNAIDGYARSGGRADIQTLSRLVQAISAEEKGNIAGSIIRKLGTSGQTGTFTPDTFALQWSQYTPQAKAILFGNAGKHRQALDDIAMISNRVKDIGKRFGNPSGTAQSVNGATALAWIWAEPISAISTMSGGWVAARVLSSPATASSAAKLANAGAKLAIQPSYANRSSYVIAVRNMVNTAQANGIDLSAVDFARLQSPSRAGAQENRNDIPGPL